MYPQARVEGITGMIQFDKSGVRHAPDLDVINLQNSSRVKVRLMKRFWCNYVLFYLLCSNSTFSNARAQSIVKSK